MSASVTTQNGLYERPVLVVDPGMHTAMLRRASVDAAGVFAVTCSDDKTVRVWSLGCGKLDRTIRLPAGPDGVGQALAVAISPDGSVIAVGGRTSGPELAESIYLFDRASGAMIGRITGLPALVGFLTFSPDGKLLVAGMSHSGIRIFAPHDDGTNALPEQHAPAQAPPGESRARQAWAEVASDADYRTNASSASFTNDGRLAVAAYDGNVKLYSGHLEGQIQPTRVFEAPGCRPFDVAFSPDGGRLAVGYDGLLAVDVLDGHTLQLETPGPDFSGVEGGDVSSIAWSLDNETLYAAGTHPPALSQTSPARKRVLAWDKHGTAPVRFFEAARTTILSLIPLQGGDLLIAAGDPWIGRVDRVGAVRWEQRGVQADFRGQSGTLAVSADGMIVDFGFEAFGKTLARFDLGALSLQLDPPSDDSTLRPNPSSLPLFDWYNNDKPRLDEWRLPLMRGEFARSAAVHPSGDSFILGADWTLAAYGVAGRTLWQRRAPGAAWAVNITRDGQLVVAACGDGVIRWLRMEDGVELLAFMPLADHKSWAAWTPEGFFASAGGAFGILRWHINRGPDAAPDSLPISEISDSFRPKILPLVLRERETPRALGLAELAEHNRLVTITTKSRVPPGARLHLLTVGISSYNDKYAHQLNNLQFADRDASELTTMILNTQRTLYADVIVQPLLNEDATRSGVLRAFDTMWRQIKAGGGGDLAVVHFSGHGALVDEKLYFLLHDVDARDEVGIKDRGYLGDEFRSELARLANYGRVLALLDACHSGAATAGGNSLTMDSRLLRESLAGQNVTVLTSSSGKEVSFEDPAWKHGAFTKVVLDAFKDPAADPDNDGLIVSTGLAHYVSSRVWELTKGAQTPGLEVRYDATIFARGM